MQRFTAMLSHFCLFSVLYGLSRCAIFNVTVGGPGVLQYNPEFVSGAPGDIVRPLKHGFDSGFVAVADSVEDGKFPVAQLTILDDSPIWVHCRQGDHCQQGMVFAVNPGNDFGAFKAAAMGRPADSTTLPTTAPASVTTAPAASSTSSSVVVITVTATVTTTPTSIVTSSSAPSSTPSSIDHRVIVGGPGLLIFQPANIKASVGDTITFEFRQKNHTVTASSFDRPCEPLSNTSTTGEMGFDSGFMPVDETSTDFPTFAIRVVNTKPIWAYCRQANHCGQGMVFAVNAVEDGPDTFAAFQSLAKQLNGTASANARPSGNGAVRALSNGCMVLVGVIGVLIFGPFL